MRLLFSRGQRLAEGFADRLSVVEDRSVPRGRPGFQTVRVVSLAASKDDAGFIARVLRSPSGLELSVRTAVPGEANPFVGHPSVSCPFRVQTRPLGENLVHVVALAETVFTQDETEPLTVLVGDEGEGAAFFRRLSAARGVPMLPEWSDEVLYELRSRGLMRDHVAVGEVRAFDVVATTSQVMDVVKDRLRYGLVSVPPASPAPDVDLDTLGTLDSYMLTFGKTLGERVLSQAPARHEPGAASQPEGVVRRLYQAQADAAAAAVKTWETERVAWVVGEQGVGKTTIALAAAKERLGGRGRILIHAPNHLVPKWEREARAVLGDIPVRVVRTWRDALSALPELRRRPTILEAWVLPRDSAKLGYLWRAVAVRHDVRSGPRRGQFSHWSCSSCGSPLERTYKKRGRPPQAWPEGAFRTRGPSNARCPRCRSPLWEADGSGPRREAPSRLLRRRLRPGAFDVLLADEIHEEKGDTGQGQSLGRLYALSRKALFLTGTLLGGKSSDLFYHLARTQPERMRQMGYAYENAAPFVRTYGVTERRERTTNLGGVSTSISEQPGVHPAVYGDWLMGSALFLGLEDLMADLPDYQEEVVMVPMDERQAAMVGAVTKTLHTLTAESLHGGSKARLGTYIQAALAYPDFVWANRSVVGGKGVVLAEPGEAWEPERLLPKETQLVAYALREKARGRRSLVYAQFTGKYDVTRRLVAEFEDVGLKTALLTTDVAPERREAWIGERVREGVDVIVCHPRLVATGLDLVDFPTILWAQTGYSLFEVRQASRRSWRLGQTKPVKVVFFAYEGTAQQACLQILGEKLLAAQAVEGRFSAEGLQALSSGRNAALQLAHALVYGLEGLPEVTHVWRSGELAEETRPAVVAVPVLPVPEPAGTVSVESVLAAFARTRRRPRLASGQLTLL